jgi:hypothetical protein
VQIQTIKWSSPFFLISQNFGPRFSRTHTSFFSYFFFSLVTLITTHIQVHTVIISTKKNSFLKVRDLSGTSPQHPLSRGHTGIHWRKKNLAIANHRWSGAIRFKMSLPVLRIRDQRSGALFTPWIRDPDPRLIFSGSRIRIRDALSFRS